MRSVGERDHRLAPADRHDRVGARQAVDEPRTSYGPIFIATYFGSVWRRRAAFAARPGRMDEAELVARDDDLVDLRAASRRRALDGDPDRARTRRASLSMSLSRSASRTVRPDRMQSSP